jgi:branched-chain amino acid transport system permease protein
MPRALRHLALTFVPLIGALAVAPFLYPNQLLLFNFIIFLILAQGVNIIYGFTGYLPFGYVGFFGAGAYGFSLCVLHLHSSAFPALAAGALCALLLALLLTPLLRLSGAYFAIANLAASMAALQIVSNPDLTNITRGPYGVSLTGVYAPNLAYGVALGILAATLALVVWLRNSRFGLALQAIREDAVTAGMAGVNVVWARTISWILSALVAGLAGGVYAWYVSVFYPETVFSSNFSIFAIVFALFGGVATATGPILGVVLLYGAYDAIGISAPQYFQLIYGLLIMGLVLFLPEGLVSIFKRWGIDVP